MHTVHADVQHGTFSWCTCALASVKEPLGDFEDRAANGREGRGLPCSTSASCSGPKTPSVRHSFIIFSVCACLHGFQFGRVVMYRGTDGQLTDVKAAGTCSYARAISSGTATDGRPRTVYSELLSSPIKAEANGLSRSAARPNAKGGFSTACAGDAGPQRTPLSCLP